MRIHSDKLELIDFEDAIRDCGIYAEGVWLDTFSKHGSRKRARAYEVRLAAHEGRDRNGKVRRPPMGGGRYPKAATYEEWGYFIAELHNRDADAIVGPYKSRYDFHSKTRGEFA